MNSWKKKTNFRKLIFQNILFYSNPFGHNIIMQIVSVVLTALKNNLLVSNFWLSSPFNLSVWQYDLIFLSIFFRLYRFFIQY